MLQTFSANAGEPETKDIKEVMRQMDPLACLNRAADALATGDFDEARLALSDYRAWRSRGGFEPPDGGDARANDLERLLLTRRTTPRTS